MYASFMCLYITSINLFPLSLGKKCTSGATAVAVLSILVDFTFTFVVSGNTLKVEKLIHCDS